jgi:uncharacterized protein involved in exopolysaccharide biosynthesis
MSSLSPLSALAHTVNESGRFGLYVDSANCSCTGCSGYHAADADPSVSVAEAAAPAAFLGSLALGRAPANQIWDGSDWVHTDSEAGRALMGQSSAVEEKTDAAMAALRALRATLQNRQDHVYEGAERSHSDMQIADQEFDDLDRKIAAIEDCMLSFGAIFRTR